jgi:hypothetical protein
MQPQGNQNTHVCLEQKQCCAATEQRKQLARKVPDQLDRNATPTHRDRLYPGTSLRNSEGFIWLKKNLTGTLQGNSSESTQRAGISREPFSCMGRRIARTRAMTLNHALHATLFAIVEFSSIAGIPVELRGANERQAAFP